jgi:hypothetical protein
MQLTGTETAFLWSAFGAVLTVGLTQALSWRNNKKILLLPYLTCS